MNLSNNNDKKSKKSGIASLFGRGSVSKIGKSQFPKSMGGIMERLKGLSRKDLALVGVGLSVLVAAPVAEYMISKPADSANMLTSGFSSRDAQGASALASLYEPGINALSQGSADGSGEVITPLSARDPYALILGAQPEQQPAMPDYSSMSSGYSDSGTSSSATSTGPSDYNDLRDSVKDSAKRGAAKAVQSAGTPTVIKNMSRFSPNKISGGGSGNQQRKISSPERANVGAKQSKMVNPVSSKGFKGATNTPNSVDSSAADRLRAKANAQGGYFSGASAVKSADAANAIKMNDKLVDGSTGSSYDGTGFGNGTSAKDPSNRRTDNKFNPGSMDCKTLSCQAAKKRQDEALKWELYWEYLPQEIAKELIKVGTDFLGDSLKKLASMWVWNEDVDGITKYYCVAPIKDDVKPDPCVEGNVKVVKYSNKSKTYTNSDWKKPCICGIMVASDMKRLYGNIGETGKTTATGTAGGNSDGQQANGGNANGSNGGSASNANNGKTDSATQTGNNGAFSGIAAELAGYADSYDENAKLFFDNITKAAKNKTSNQGAGFAIASVDSFDARGIGTPLDQIVKLAIDSKDKGYKLDTELINANLNLYNQYKTNVAGVEKEYKEFLEKLNTLTNEEVVKANMEKYSDGSELANQSYSKIASEVKKNLIPRYKNAYHRYVELSKEDIEAHKAAITVFSNITKNSMQQVSNVADDYGKMVGMVRGYKNNIKANPANKEDPQGVVAYLKEVRRATGTEDNQAAAGQGASIFGEYVPMRAAPNSGSKVAVNSDLYAEELVYVWRGISKDEFKSDKKISDSMYKKAAKKVQETEIANWKTDCPLEMDKDFSPKADMPKEYKMTKFDFYSPAYRLLVEIPAALKEQTGVLAAKLGSLSDMKDEKKRIEAELSKLGIKTDQPTTPQGNTNTPENQGNTQTEVEYDSCVQGKNCSYSQVKKLEKQAADHGHYSSASTAEIWNGDWLYRDLRPEWQNDAKVGSDYNTHAVKAHNLRSYIDDLAVKYESATYSDTKKMYKEKIDSSKNSLKEEINATNEAWKKICVSHNENNPSRCKTNMFDVPPNNTSGNNAGSGNANMGNPATGNNGDTNNGTSGNNAGSGPLIGNEIKPGAQIGNEIKPGAQIGNEIKPGAQINQPITRGGGQNSDQAKSDDAKKHPRNDKGNPRKMSMKLTSNKTITGSYDGYKITVAEIENNPNTYYGKAVRETDNKEFRIHFSCNAQNKVVSPVIVHIPGGEKMFEIDGNVPCESN